MEAKQSLFVFGINCYVIGICYTEALCFLTERFAYCLTTKQLSTREVVCFMLLIRMRKSEIAFGESVRNCISRQAGQVTLILG